MNRSSSAFGVRVAMLGVAWCLVVPGFYYFYNYPYYAEKIGTFARFLLSVMT